MIPLKMQGKKTCNYNEKIEKKERAWGHWFRRIDALAEIVKD